MSENKRQSVIDVPDEVKDSEYVARVVSDSSFLQDGKISSAAFELRNTKRVPDESYVSVMRMNYWDEAGVINKFQAQKGEDVRGYAKMHVGKIREISNVIDNKKLDVDVKAEKNGKQQSPHAGIFTMVDSNVVTGSKICHVNVIWTYVQNKLVEIAEYVH